MPIDKMMSDSMLGTFRTMLQECRDKNMSGPSFDAMAASMETMEKYAREMDDFGAFSAKLMTEGLFTSFSTYYSQVLAEAARANQSGGSGEPVDEDAGYLKQTLSAYEAAISRYDSDVASGAMKAADTAILKAGVQAVIDLGHSGVTYPVFLRTLIEKGYDKLLEGSALARSALVTQLEWAQFMNHPVEIRKCKTILACFDELASSSPFGVPDSFVFNLKRGEIEWEFAPELEKWRAIKDRMYKIVDTINDWIDSFASFAPLDDRWVDASNPAATKKNIRRTQELAPYWQREREQFFREAFGFGWHDMFSHKVWQNAWDNVDIPFSAEKIALLRKLHPQCVPGAEPSREYVEEAERLHATKADYRFAEREAVGEKMKAKYDSYYGTGAYGREFGAKK